jgi:hypothetical protein
MGQKRETVTILVRLPASMKTWVETEAALNGASRNSEIVRTIRARMDIEQKVGR